MLLFGKEPVAQLVEHRPFKARAVGSNPTGFTKVDSKFRIKKLKSPVYSWFFEFCILAFT